MEHFRSTTAYSRQKDEGQILIVTQIYDPHADDVIRKLQQMGHEPLRLNTQDIPLNTKISLDFSNDNNSWNGLIEIMTNGRIVDVDAVRSIWWRRPGQPILPNELSEQEREFATGEINHILHGLWSSLDCYWVSHPENIRRAGWKGEQLQRAARLGFEIPLTLITTDPGEARAFYDTCAGRMIFKVATDPFLAASTVAQKHPDQPLTSPHQTPTTLITESELRQLDSVRLSPCMFQEYVPKQVELRVTVIGDDLFVAEIHSQASEKTSIDWRHYDANIPYHEAQLPDEVAERCLALVKSYGLNFSALDLILTPDGRYVFLENNPNGQFIFIEHLVPELNMTEALAASLVRGGSS